MKWTDETRIETPEQIGLDLELAGLGSRFLAQLVDWIWKLLLTALLALLTIVILGLVGQRGFFEDLSGFMLGLIIAVVYLIWLGYGIFFEVRGNGQTPGKRSAGIRVIQANGAPIDFRAAGIRNLMAVADFIPVLYLLGALLILLTERKQRLGDMAAGTIVVRERVESLSPAEAEDLTASASEEYAFTHAHLSPLTGDDRNVLREFLRRYPEMEPRSRERLAGKMARNFQEKTGYLVVADLDGDDAVVFLASLLRDLEEMLRHG